MREREWGGVVRWGAEGVDRRVGALNRRLLALARAELERQRKAADSKVGDMYKKDEMAICKTHMID